MTNVSGSNIKWFTAAAAGLCLTLAAFVAAALLMVDETSLLTYKRQMVDFKLARLKAPGRSPHVIFIGGSGTLYSIDSSVIEKTLGRPATNAGVHWGMSFYMMDRVAELSRPGDVIVLPLEYGMYAISGMTDTEACYLIAQDKRRLGNLSDIIEVFRSCPQRILAYGIASKVRWLVLGPGSWSATDEMNAEGDLIVNTPEAAAKVLFSGSIGASPKPGDGYGFDRIGAAIEVAKRHGARVFLSYPAFPPTPPDSERYLQQYAEMLSEWAGMKDVEVLSTPESHIFPSECFFDQMFHLHRGCSPRNSLVYAEALTRVPKLPRD